MSTPTPPLPSPGSSPFGNDPFGTTPVAPPAAPPGAYAVPVGGYQAPVGGYSVPPTAPPASRTMGALALIAALIAALIMPVVGSIFAYRIGVAAPDLDPFSSTAADLSILSPVRTEVLWAEVSFWAGTVLGILGMVFGIIATVKRRGRGMGIGAIIASGVGPGVYLVAMTVLFGIGAALGFSGTAV